MSNLSLRSFTLCFFIAIALISVAFPCKQIRAATFTSAASGLWQTPATWGSATVPTSGDSIVLNSHTIEVNDSRSFGQSGVPSLLQSNVGTFFLNGASTSLTHVSGSTAQQIANRDIRITGTGTFTNQGRFEVQTSGSSYGLLLWNGSPTFVNAAPTLATDKFVMTHNNSWLQLGYNPGDTPVFQNDGVFEIDLPSNSNIARISSSRPESTLGQYLASSPITFTRGALVFSPPNINAYNDTNFNQLFGTTNTNSELRIAGEIQSINLTSAGITASKLARVSIGHDFSWAGQFVAHSAGTSINVAEADGGIFFNNILGGGNPTIHMPGARTVTNEALSLIKGGTNTRITGTGTFINDGKFTVSAATSASSYGLLLYNGSPTFQNNGNVTLTANDSRIELGYLATDAPVFQNDGVLDIALGANNRVAYIGSNRVESNLGQYQATQAINFTQGILVFSPPNITTYDDASVSALFGSINNNSELRLAGEIQTINLSAAGITPAQLARISLAHDRTFGRELVAHAAGTTIYVPEADGGISFNNILGGGDPTIDIPAGRTATNLAGSLITAGTNTRVTGDGEFINNGKFKLTSKSSFGQIVYDGSPTFTNNGVVEFTQNNGELLIGYNGTDVALFNNASGGVLQTNLPSSTDLAIVRRFGGSGTFQNNGSVEVTSGILRFESSITTPDVTSNSLTGGTWKVLAGTNNATLDIQSSGATAGSITTIGAGAKLVLSKSGTGFAILPQLGAVQTLDGEFFVHGDHSQIVGSTMNVTGTLGGDGTFTSTGSIAFNGGVLDPSSLTGGAGTLTINGNLSLSSNTELAFSLGTPEIVGSGINDLVEVDGDLVLDGVLDVTSLAGFDNGVYRLFNYTGTLTDNGLITSNPNYIISLSTAGQVNLQIVPEPATGLLLLAGCMIFRRKRRQ